MPKFEFFCFGGNVGDGQEKSCRSIHQGLRILRDERGQAHLRKLQGSVLLQQGLPETYQS
jgi:hypothetical protein